MALDLEEVWRIREEDIYPALFGPLTRGIFPLTAQLFTERFKRVEIEPRWLHYGVLEFGPTPERPFWLYVTSGHSNPWYVEPTDYDPSATSGSGVEFLFAAPEQADWPIVFLQNMLAFSCKICWRSICFSRSAILLGVGLWNSAIVSHWAYLSTARIRPCAQYWSP